VILFAKTICCFRFDPTGGTLAYTKSALIAVFSSAIKCIRKGAVYETNLLTAAAEITAGVALYALPWIPSEQAQRMIHPSVAAHSLECALT
jgi:hypothetical protein